MKIRQFKSPNFDPRPRSSSAIKFIIIHYTGMQSTRVSLKRLISQKAKVSSHYLISEKGAVFKLVDENNVAWHAGQSKWKSISNLNNRSIGIELSNKGHFIKYESYKKKQLASLVILLKLLVKKFKVPHENILGHSDIAPLRKKDPGEKFPCKELAKRGIGIWHSISDNKLKKNRKIELDKISEKKFYKNLSKFGYVVKKNENLKNRRFNNYIVKAFQRRFRQELVNGKLDKECLIISNNLVEKFN